MSKQNLVTSINTLLCGMHPRLGAESPVSLLSELPSRIISDIVLEEEHLLERILCDYYDYSGHSPCDEGEFQNDLELMRSVYLHNPSTSSLARLTSYANNTQDDFMEQQAEVISCQACGTSCYYIGHLKVTPVCSYCHEDDTLLGDISVWEIPVYIDIDTFCWKEVDTDPETYADACAMYGWGPQT
jgi:hypothetical protein